jgi:hypothetical protein
MAVMTLGGSMEGRHNINQAVGWDGGGDYSAVNIIEWLLIQDNSNNTTIQCRANWTASQK